MIDEKFYARIQNIARASGFSVKPLSLPYIAGTIRKELDDDAAASAILHVMKEARLSKPDQFTTAEQMLGRANASAMEKLEAANAKTFAEREAERLAANRAKPTINLSSRELALPPQVRMALYDEKMAAALAAQKKVTP